MLAYGLDNPDRIDHDLLTDKTTEYFNCSREAVYGVLYGPCYKSRLAPLRNRVPGYVPQRIDKQTFETRKQLPWYNFDARKQLPRDNFDARKPR